MAPTVTEQAQLAPLTTLRVGGPARRLVEVATETELLDVVRAADAAAEPLLVLAGGSNVVIADSGFDGTVCVVRTRGMELGSDGDRARMTVAAGEPWDPVVQRAVAEGLAGLECLSGIPGSTGATPIQNVGAYGQEVASTIAAVRVFDRDRDEVVQLDAAQCVFGYRTSAFKYRDRRIVLSVDFELDTADLSQPIRYAELARTLGVEPGERVPLADAREAVLALRRGKGMVIDPEDPDSVSAGSFFTNPVLPEARFAELLDRVAERLGPDVEPPRYPDRDGHAKTSAGWLIERAGFAKGYRRGNVAISSKHTLALVNRGGASAADLVALAREIVAGVHEAFGVELRPEPVFVGHCW
ncbi:MAG: UDP-N-acetylmuramate dehydrogenase [Solirubrobacterales bacterium]